MKKGIQKPKIREVSKAIKTNKETARRIQPKHVTDIEQLKQLRRKERTNLKKVTEKFAFRSNEYYLSLIDWHDCADPIRRIVVPSIRELKEWGRLDPSDEKCYTVMPGLEHKYDSTVLLLVSNTCDGICRYCFRKRLFLASQQAVLKDLSAAIQYIKQHCEITNALLTGGDPLALCTSRLEHILKRLRQIKHVRIIRIGTKVPAFNPFRILDDPQLLEVIKKYSTSEKKIYVITHFVHPRELTDLAVKAVNLLQEAGAELANQMPLIRGVNNNVNTLAELLKRLSFIGIVPYYVFQCRPAVGNKGYTVPIEQGYEVLERAKACVSGLAKPIRFVISHSTGKIEVIGKTDKYIYFKYHRAADDRDNGRFMQFRSNPWACWFDDYDEVIQDYSTNLPYRLYGPE